MVETPQLAGTSTAVFNGIDRWWDLPFGGAVGSATGNSPHAFVIESFNYVVPDAPEASFTDLNGSLDVSEALGGSDGEAAGWGIPHNGSHPHAMHWDDIGTRTDLHPNGYSDSTALGMDYIA